MIWVLALWLVAGYLVVRGFRRAHPRRSDERPRTYAGGSVRVEVPSSSDEHWVYVTYPGEAGQTELWGHSEADLAELVAAVAQSDTRRGR